MEYLYLKLGDIKKGFIDVPNGINLNATNPYKFVDLSQINRNITLALNSGLLLQVSGKEYEEAVSPVEITNIIVQPDQYSFFPTLDNKVSVIDRLNVTSYQLLTSTPETKFKDYPNYIVKVVGSNFYLYKPLNGADAVVSFSPANYWGYVGGNYPLGTWNKFINTIIL